MIDYKFSLELTKNGIQKSIHAKSGEENARRLIIALTVKGNAFDLNGKKIKVFFHDGTCSEEFEPVNNKIIFVLPSGLTASPGKKICEFKIYKDGQAIFSPAVEVEVEGSAADNTTNTLIGKKVEYQETIPSLQTTETIADEDEIAVYDSSEGKTFRILWSKIKSLFATKSDIKGFDEKFAAASDFDEAVEEISDNLDTLNRQAHSHENDEVIDLLGVSDEGNLTYNGKEIKSNAATTENLPDFREDNETAVGFIKNKTHYEYGRCLRSSDGQTVKYREPDTNYLTSAVKICGALEDTSFLETIYPDQLSFVDAEGNKVNGEDFVSDVSAERYENCYDTDASILIPSGLIEYVKTQVNVYVTNKETGTPETITIDEGLYFYESPHFRPGYRLDALFVAEKMKKLHERFISSKSIKSVDILLDYTEGALVETGGSTYMVTVGQSLLPENIEIVDIGITASGDEMSMVELYRNGYLGGGAFIRTFVTPQTVVSGYLGEAEVAVAVIDDAIGQSVLLSEIASGNVTKCKIYYKE